MYLTNNQITITCTLSMTAIVYIVTDFDKQVRLPDKSVIYTDALTVVSFTAPTVDTEGSLVFTYTPTVVGVHAIVISKGIASAYQELYKIMLNVNELTLTKSVKIELP